MIIIDETKLSQETLVTMLVELQGEIDLDKYWHKSWTENEIALMMEHYVEVYPKHKLNKKQYEQSLRIACTLDEEAIIADLLDKYKCN